MFRRLKGRSQLVCNLCHSEHELTDHDALTYTLQEDVSLYVNIHIYVVLLLLKLDTIYRQESMSPQSLQPSEYSCYIVFESALLLLFAVCRNCLSKAVESKRTTKAHCYISNKPVFAVITNGNGKVNQCVAIYRLVISLSQQLFCMLERYRQRL